VNWKLLQSTWLLLVFNYPLMNVQSQSIEMCMDIPAML